MLEKFFFLLIDGLQVTSRLHVSLQLFDVLSSFSSTTVRWGITLLAAVKRTLGMMRSFNVGSDDGVKHLHLLKRSFFAFVIKISIKNCPFGTTPTYLPLYVYEALFFNVCPDFWITQHLEKKSLRFVFVVQCLANFKRKTLNTQLYFNLI